MASSGTSNNTKTLITIFCLLFFPLIGLILMWVWTHWKLWIKIVISLFFTLYLLIVILTVVYLFVARPFQVLARGMYPTYKEGGYFIAKLRSPSDTIKRNDVVLYYARQPKGIESIKRVVAIPGDTISLQNGQILVNGAILNEIFYTGAKTGGGTFLYEGKTVNIPQGQYFLLGDNRAYSLDSREQGLTSADQIMGVASPCYLNCK